MFLRSLVTQISFNAMKFLHPIEIATLSLNSATVGTSKPNSEENIIFHNKMLNHSSKISSQAYSISQKKTLFIEI